jgi:hypothetical protein
VRRLVVLLAVLGAAAAPAWARPAGQPPASTVAVTRAGGPPAAWVATRAGERWLATASTCWRRAGSAEILCVGPVARRAEIPRLTVRRGESVRFRLGFAPTQTPFLRIGTRTFRLARSTAPAWRAAGTGGQAQLIVRGTRGDVVYAAAFTVRA